MFDPSSLVTPIRSIRTYSIAAAPRIESEKDHIYRYTISVAFSAKQKKFSRDRNVYHFHQHEDPAVLVKEQQKLQVFAGQDAFFVSRMQNNGAVAVGVVCRIRSISD